MALFSKKFLWLWFLLFSAVFAAQVTALIFQESPTNDEPIELTTGYFYWKGDLLVHDYHPPVAKTLQALPLRFMGLKDNIPANYKDAQMQAYIFFFGLNSDHLEQMIHNGRFISLLFGLGLGLLLFLCVRNGPFITSFCALALWAFHPTFLAYSSLCLADLPLAFFFFLAVLLFREHLKKTGLSWALAAGSLAGLAASAKYSALALIPLFLILEAEHWFSNSEQRREWKTMLLEWVAGIAGFVAAIGLIFLPGTLFIDGHFNPWFFFLKGLQHMMSYSTLHHPSYFWGVGSQSDHWLYFPATFLLKDTLPFLMLLLGAAIAGSMGKVKFPFWLWFSPLFFFICVLPVQNLGIRYLLPAFPFFILLAAQFAQWLCEYHPPMPTLKGIWLVALLIAWHASTTLLNFPNMISYFNELIVPGTKWLYLGDNDLDIGQDVKRFAALAKARGWEHIKLAQFGGAVDPSFYGVPVETWTQKDLQKPQLGYVYALNMSVFQIAPMFQPQFLPIAQSWAQQAKPTGRLGDTWIYFETQGHPTADHSAKISSIWPF